MPRNSPQNNRFLPASLVALREGYSLPFAWNDLLAGVTVGVVALPLAMAFGIASGVSPDKGLYTAIVAGFLISVLGGSRFQIGGPTGAFVVIVYDVVQRHGYQGLALATLMAGMMLVVMGLVGLGRMVKFIPYPVTTGFTTGIAVIIFSSQIKDFLGLPMGAPPGGFVEKWTAYAQALSQWNPTTTLLALGSLAVLLLFPRISRRVPAPFVVLVAASAVVWWWQLPVDTIGSRFGGIPQSLPTPSLPQMDWTQVRLLLPDAFTIALLAAIESLLCAVVADGMTGTRHKSNVELVAQGIANMGAILFGGIPATGAIARTATNIRAGAKTPLAGVIHALTLLGIILVLAPLAVHVPLAALAAILVVVAWNMAEAKHFLGMARAPMHDLAVMLTTFGLTVLVDLNAAIQAGVVLAALLFMKRMSDITQVSGIADSTATEDDPDATRLKSVPPGVEVYEIDGPFFFGAADVLQDALSHLRKTPPVCILRMRKVPVIDATGIHALREFWEKSTRRGSVVVLSGVNPEVAKALQRFGLLERIGAANVLPHIDLALARARKILEEK